MNLLVRLDVNVFAVFVLVVLLINARKGLNPGNKMAILFTKLAALVLMITLIEITSYMVDMKSGSTMFFLNYISNALLFLLAPAAMYLWVEYVDHFFIRDTQEIKKRRYYRNVLASVTVLLVLVNLFNGMFFQILEGNVYQRGPLFLVQMLLNIAIVLQAYIIIFKNRRRLDDAMLWSLALFPVLPLLGTVIQSLFYGTTMILSYMAMSLLLIFLNVQRTLIFLDSLTGLDNRRSIDLKMESMSERGKECLYAGMMVDIDNLKEINDRYGHATGDMAIKHTAEIIKNSLRKGDFVARYAGDEFFAVMDVKDYEALKVTVKRIESAFEKFNHESGVPWKLSVSIGYDLFRYESPESMEDDMRRIDALMYEEKKRRKNLNQMTMEIS
jgi:diguanylate cyclase (GGDEF)-like protein